MRWRGRRQSSNIEDVRSRGGGLGGGLGGSLGGGFGRGRVTRAGGGMGIGTILVLFVIAWLLGINPLTLISGELTGEPQTRSAPGGEVSGQRTADAPVNDEMRDFVATVLADTEDTWGEIFKAGGETYADPELVLFSGGVRSACGTATSSSGPFYCPNDRKVYIDLNFYGELRQRFGAPGDFAQAYVLAHEVGHHVQNLLGVLPKVHSAQQRADQADANALSVRLELQADCFAGVWANHTEKKGILEPGDIDEALTAAAAVGDDTIQERTQGYVVPESFNHGTAEQRATWFRKGFEGGRVDSCDTFGNDV